MSKKALQDAICLRVRTYDPCALVKTLLQAGYQWDDIFFKGDYDFTSASCLCKKIAFHDGDKIKVTITLNLGLLSPNTSMPSYFFQAIDQSPSQGESFQKFIGYFNHFTLKNLIQMQLLELSPHLFSSWSAALEDYFCLTGLNSLLALDSLFRLVFPDLDLKIKKMPQKEIVKNSIFRLGTGSLGENAILGGNATKTFESFRISLYSNEDFRLKGQPWAEEIKSRLNEVVFPLLTKTSLHLLIELVVRKPKNQLKLSLDSFLGLERIGKNSFPSRLLIFYGETTNQTQCSAQPSCDGSDQINGSEKRLQSK